MALECERQHDSDGCERLEMNYSRQSLLTDRAKTHKRYEPEEGEEECKC